MGQFKRVFVNVRFILFSVPDIPLDKPLYPVITSTSSKSGLRLIFSRSYYQNLTFECVKSMFGRRVPQGRKAEVLAQLGSCPGLNKMVMKDFYFLMGAKNKDLLKHQKSSSSKSELVIE